MQIRLKICFNISTAKITSGMVCIFLLTTSTDWIKSLPLWNIQSNLLYSKCTDLNINNVENIFTATFRMAKYLPQRPEFRHKTNQYRPTVWCVRQKFLARTTASSLSVIITEVWENLVYFQRMLRLLEEVMSQSVRIACILMFLGWGRCGEMRDGWRIY